MSAPRPRPDPLRLALLRQRTALGLVGLALPVVLVALSLAFGAEWARSSISMHFWLPNIGAVFAGAMTAIGIFLLFYRGHPNRPDDHMLPLFDAPFWRRLTDARLTSIAGLGALGTGLVPVCPAAPLPDVFCSNLAHLGFVVLFFAALTVMALVQFTRSDLPLPDQPQEKRWRTRFFVACGLVMAGALVLIVPVSLIPATKTLRLFGFGAVFWLEAVAVWAFALAWLVKGEAYAHLPDRLVPEPLKAR